MKYDLSRLVEKSIKIIRSPKKILLQEIDIHGNILRSTNLSSEARVKYKIN